MINTRSTASMEGNSSLTSQSIGVQVPQPVPPVARLLPANPLDPQIVMALIKQLVQQRLDAAASFLPEFSGVDHEDRCHYTLKNTPREQWVPRIVLQLREHTCK